MAFLGLSIASGSPVKLEAEAKLRKKNLLDTTVPVCAVKLCLGKGGGVTLEVTMSAQGLAPFKGWHEVPLNVNSEEDRPESEEVRRELFTFLNKCRGHNNVPKLQRYYEETVTTWPDEEHKMLMPENLWPEFRGMAGGPPNLAPPGKTK